MKPIVLALIALAAVSVLGQNNQTSTDRTGGYAANSPYEKQFNPKGQVTITGKVVGISVSPPVKGMGNAASILVKVSKTVTTLVDLGPEWFINHQPISVQVGDDVEVTGSQTKAKDQSTMLASKIVDGSNTLVLRDKDGKPVWDAWRQKFDATQRYQKINGKVVDIAEQKDGDHTYVVTLATLDGNVQVLTGPEWFLDHQNIQIQLGDQLSVYAGQDVPVSPGVLVEASAIQVDQGWMVFRQGGAPVWTSWRQVLKGGG